MNEAKIGKFIVIASAGTILSLAFAADAERYVVGPGSRVQFLAKATSGEYTAQSQRIRGVVDYDPSADVIKMAVISINANSIDTGNKRRNEKLRKKYLQTSKYQDIRFEARNSPFAAIPQQETMLKGSFTLKGIRRRVIIPTVMEREAGDWRVLNSRFTFNLKDYGIKPPRFLTFKMHPEVVMTARLLLQPRKKPRRPSP